MRRANRWLIILQLRNKNRFLLFPRFHLYDHVHLIQHLIGLFKLLLLLVSRVAVNFVEDLQSGEGLPHAQPDQLFVDDPGAVGVLESLDEFRSGQLVVVLKKCPNDSHLIPVVRHRQPHSLYRSVFDHTILSQSEFLRVPRDAIFK